MNKLSYEQKAGIHKIVNWLNKYPEHWDGLQVGYGEPDLRNLINKISDVAHRGYYNYSEAMVLNKLRTNYIESKRNEHTKAA